jgi:putative CocE/NonD family hydrolase
MGTEEHIFIEMSDGVRLAGNLYLPDEPAPVVLEALPYRKDDLTANYTPEYRRLRDEGGYAVARIDLRGCGSSEGLATDEYPVAEQRDLCEVISWLARQDFTTGNVGMYGTSYSGFNSIQVAMERPPELKAIVAIYATDDRYTDDVHFEGGALRALDQIDYCLYMTPMNALPPVPSIADENWLDMWRQRVETLEPWLLRWIEEQNDGPYWRHGSLRPRYDEIEAATMIVGGWADGYRNATFRAFEQLQCNKRLLIGPWSHASAESALPGPHIDLVSEMIRWWDRWLRDKPNGIDDEPAITIFVRHSTKPEADLAEMRGEWRHEQGWPPDRLTEREHSLDSALRPAGATDSLEVHGDVGWSAHLSCAGVMPWGQPQDQRPDEAYSLVYDWGPFDADVEILGYPRARLAVSADRPVAFVSAKLCDVFEDGTSALISRGFLNLTHRDSHANPQRLEAGVVYEVSFDLTATSWVLPRGHRLRLSLAGTDWPNVWPPPEPVTLTFDPGRSTLELPVIDGTHELPAPQLRPPPSERGDPPDATKSPDTVGREAGSAGPQDQRVSWRVEHDVLERETRYIVDHGSVYDTEMGSRVTESYFGRVVVSTSDPGDCRAEGRVRFEIAWPEATAVAEVQATLGSNAGDYRLELDLDVIHDGASLGRRHWERTFPRRLQ